MLMRRWTPPSQVPTTSLDNVGGQRTCLRWCKLIVSALLPLAIISFCVVYTLQKDNFFNEEYRREQQNEQKNQQRLAFETYIQDISNVLSHDTKEKYLHIQSKTLFILRHIELQRKKDILLFLYETNLLKDNQLNLYGADFNNVELTCPHDFNHLHLQGVHWSNGMVINCHLAWVNFDQALLSNIQFINSTIHNSSFIGSKLDRSQFVGTNVRYVDFNGASLVQANFLKAEMVQGNNFTNADLHQASFTNDQLEGKMKFSIIAHDFTNARYPNGSFQSTNSHENLIVNGNAETDCPSNHQPMWKTIDSSMSLSSEIIQENSTDNVTHWNNCSFVVSSAIRAYQSINLHAYSLLIDSEKSAINFTGMASCNQSYFEIHMYRSDEILHEMKIHSKPTEPIQTDLNQTIYRYGEYQHPVPVHTRRIEVYFGIKELGMNSKCYFDNIALTLHTLLP